MTIVGWDIGGANLKQATNDGRAGLRPFELWRRPDDLAAELQTLFRPIASETDALAVTITGELADCFATKSKGVDRILAAVEHVADARPVSVWSTGGRFMSVSEARSAPLSVAAANWHALATWVGRLVEAQPHGSSAATARTTSGLPHSSLLIDVGSTTTDIIPIDHDQPRPRGLTDVARLQVGELIYTGVRRTPLCAVLPRVRWRCVETPVAAELFATMLDVYLLLGDIPPDEQDCHTANGQPATIACAHDRIARMLCCDRDELPFIDAVDLARQWAAAQQCCISERVKSVASQLPGPCSAVVLSGSGEFLARRVLDGLGEELSLVARISLTDRFGPSLAESACAFAVASLLAISRSKMPRT